jgi:hypothetical protein
LQKFDRNAILGGIMKKQRKKRRNSETNSPNFDNVLQFGDGMPASADTAADDFSATPR